MHPTHRVAIRLGEEVELFFDFSIYCLNEWCMRADQYGSRLHVVLRLCVCLCVSVRVCVYAYVCVCVCACVY